MSAGRIPTTANSPLTVKGDLFTFSTGSAKLAVGTNGQVLTADSTQSTGLKFATPAVGGKLLQVVNATYATQTANSTSTYADSGLTGTITPTLITSKILVLLSVAAAKSDQNSGNRVGLNLVRGASSIVAWYDDYGFFTNSAMRFYGTLSFNYLDSPATTSATIYKVEFKNVANVAQVETQPGNTSSSITLLEIGA